MIELPQDPATERPQAGATSANPQMEGDMPRSPYRTSSKFVTALRFARLAIHFIRAWFELVLMFPHLSAAQRSRRVQAWCARFLRIANLTVQAEGASPAGGSVMLVSNHVSWLDMVVIQSLKPTLFVAKSEVRQWPVIGTISTRCGTVYVQRKHLRGMAEVHARITGLLRAGETVTLFPEGTTSDGAGVQKFHASLLQAPIDAAAFVQPVGLSYLEARTGALCSRVAYAGDDTLARSMWRTLSRQTVVRVRFGDTLHSKSWSRRELGSELQQLVVSLRARSTVVG